MTDIQELKRLAVAATPGEWGIFGGNDVQVIVQSDDQFICNTVHGNDMPNAAFIAAANPSTILSLIERIEALEKNQVPEGQICVSMEAIESMANIDAFNAPAGAAMRIKLAAQLMLRKAAIAQQDKGKETV